MSGDLWNTLTRTDFGWQDAESVRKRRTPAPLVLRVLSRKSQHRAHRPSGHTLLQKAQLVRQEARNNFNFFKKSLKRQHNRKVGTSQKQRTLQATLIGNSKTLGW